MMTQDGRHSGAEPQGSQIVPASQPPVDPGHGWLWFAGIAVSVIVMARYPMLGAACLAMGLRNQAERFGIRGYLFGLGIALAVLAAWAAALGPASMLFAIQLVGICAAISALMWRGRAGATSVALVVAVATALSMSIDALAAAGAGTNLADATVSMLMEVARASVGQGLEARLTLAGMEPVIELIWPMVYVLSALLDAAIAGAGSFLGSVQRPPARRELPTAGYRLRVPQASRFDAPLWSVGALALSVLGIAASFAAIPEAQLVRTLSVTLFLSVRVIFMLQGVAVALGLLNRWRVGCFGRVAAIMIAVWLEMMFVLSIIGLIDVWANFRKLPRNGSHAEAHT